MAFHASSWVVPASGDYIVVCQGGGGSGGAGQNTPYRGGGGGGGAYASIKATEVLGHTVDLIIPDPGVSHVNGVASAATYGHAGSSTYPCSAAPGTAPSFFGPAGLGGTVASSIGTTRIAGVDGGGPVPDFTVGAGHNGGAGAGPGSGIGGLGGPVNDALGGQDGISPGGGGGGGGSQTTVFASQFSAESGGYVLIYRASDWPLYPGGNPQAAPIATFGTLPTPSTTIRAYAFVM